jgi:hypothetical protein
VKKDTCDVCDRTSEGRRDYSIVRRRTEGTSRLSEKQSGICGEKRDQLEGVERGRRKKDGVNLNISINVHQKICSHHLGSSKQVSAKLGKVKGRNLVLRRHEKN